MTKQENFWSGEFGKEYSQRNSHSIEDWNKFYKNNWGVTRIEMNEIALKGISKGAKILEVGCNTGMQLRGMQLMGFEKLFGVEIQSYAVEKAKEFTQGINIIHGSGFDLPFKDMYFNITCTNGVLIHISPKDLPKIMDEIYRCSARYIWGWEYYSKEIEDINYRGNKGFLWKGDYAQLYLDRFPDLELVSFHDYPYINESEKGNVDRMFLLEKKI